MKYCIEEEQTKNAVPYYSAHTFTINCHLTYYEKNILINSFEKYSRIHHLQRYEKKLNNLQLIYYRGIANLFGFNEIKFLHSTPRNTEIDNYWVEILVNPRRIYHKGDHPFAYIATLEEIAKCIKHIEHMLQEVGADEISIELFKLKRIDLCVNISLGSTAASNEYTQLLLKGAYPHHFERRMEYSKTGKRLIPTKDAFTVCSRNIEFSLYNKYRQLKKEEDIYDENEIKEAEGIIRIEFRINRPIIYQLNKKHNLGSIEEFIKVIPQLAQDSFPRYIGKFYGTGKFYTLDKARELVLNSQYKNKTKESLLFILETVAKEKSLQEVKKYFSSTRDFSKLIDKFNRLGVSPITIPRRNAIKCFENPLFYIENCNCNHGR